MSKTMDQIQQPESLDEWLALFPGKSAQKTIKTIMAVFKRDLAREMKVPGAETRNPFRIVRDAVNLPLAVELADLAPLGILQNLRILEIFTVTTKCDLSPLAELPNLQELRIKVAEGCSVAPLARATELRKLDISGLRSSDVALLAPLPKLEVLKVSRVPEADLSGFAAGPLKSLHWGAQEVKSIESLAGLRQLESLDVGCNEIRDISPLAGLTNLVSLNIGVNRIRDISPLRHLVRLKDLQLEGNCIADLRPALELPVLDDYDKGKARESVQLDLGIPAGQKLYEDWRNPALWREYAEALGAGHPTAKAILERLDTGFVPAELPDYWADVPRPS